MAKRRRTVSEVLASALEKFGPNGEHWIKGYEHSRKGGEDRYCMIGAIKASTRNANLIDEADRIVRDVLPTGYYSVPMYNDAGKTDFAAVKSAMCKAVNKAVQEESESAS